MKIENNVLINGYTIQEALQHVAKTVSLAEYYFKEAMLAKNDNDKGYRYNGCLLRYNEIKLELLTNFNVSYNNDDKDTLQFFVNHHSEMLKLID